MDTKASLTVTATVFVLLSLRAIIRRRRSSTVRDIAGPESKSWVFGACYTFTPTLPRIHLAPTSTGNLAELLLPSSYGQNEFAWTKSFGPVYRVKGCFGQDRLVISDPVALQYITNSPNFQLGPVLAVMRSWLYDRNSVITVRVALGCPIEDLGPEFLSVNTRLLDIASTRSTGQIIFDAIAVHVPKPLLRAMIHLPTSAFRALRTSKFLSRREGWRIIREKLQAPEGNYDADIYSLLMHPDEKNGTKKTLHAEDLVAQTSLILLAGQDTTANTLAFGLLELARRPDLQNKLRDEIHATISGSRDAAYDNMPLLNAFIKETLRMYPAAALSERVALQNSVVPLAEGITTSSGKKIDAIPVDKGQVVMLGIAAYQRHGSRWGANSEDFDPDRWLDGRVRQGEAIGPYANLLSFFAGPHTCLGWRFAIMEMQTVLCELVGNFAFSVPEKEKGPFRLRLATTLLPLDAKGEKGAKLCVRRVV
ncbi:Cytochrome P450 [Mycena venus]|uniref:Cytochrome P450 n=1 Tax=Mycena venus TaxID=2733690 RepID=A0A8H6Y8A1_9AGAR|nr:Cytochrome P450 [Mycena venus]